MNIWARVAAVLVLAVLFVGAVGANPRYIEELRIGGGFGETADGGADLEKDGDIATNGTIAATKDIAAGANEGIDHSVSVLSGSGRDSFLNLNETNANNGGAAWYDGSADRLYIGTRNNTSSVTNALEIQQGSSNVRVLGNLTVNGQVSTVNGSAGLSAQSLLGLWHCEAISNTINWEGSADALSFGGSGTTSVSGKYGTAINFNGSGYAATASNRIPNNAGTSSMTVAAWVKFSSASGIHTIAGWHSSKTFLLYADSGKLTFWIGDGTNSPYVEQASAVSNDNAWHHVAGVRDRAAGVIKLYVDAALVGQVSDTTASISLNSSLYVGAASATPTWAWSGGIDELALWNRALGDSEIAALAAQSVEMLDPYGPELINGNLTSTGDGAFDGGDVDFGKDSSVRGVLTLWDGDSGNAPGAIKIASPNGTIWYLFVEDDGTVKVNNALPTSNVNGSVVGLQF